MEIVRITKSQVDLGEDFQSLDEIELRTQSRSWTPEQWESYLKTIESPLSESLISPGKYMRISETSEIGVFDFAQSHPNVSLQARIKLLLEILTVRERQAIELLFLKAKTSREAALELGVRVSRIAALKKKALKKLRLFLGVGVNAFPLVEGKFKKN